MQQHNLNIQSQHEIHLKPYSDNVLGYIVRLNLLNGVGFEIVINSNLTHEEQEYAYNRLVNEETLYQKYGFVMLHSNNVMYYYDSYNYNSKDNKYKIGYDKSKVTDINQHRKMKEIFGNNAF